MTGMSDVQIINRALGKIPAKKITARDDRSPSAREAANHYDPTLQLCLRRGLTPWSFATKRIQLTATNETPVNEFSKVYDLPGDCLAIQMFWPKDCAYRKEGGRLLTNASTIIIKYTSNEVLSKSYLMEFDFMEYFTFALAAEMAPTLSEDPQRTQMLSQKAEEWFRHAAASFSMEDTPDRLPESPWIIAHEGGGGEGSWQAFRDAPYDFNSIP